LGRRAPNLNQRHTVTPQLHEPIWGIGPGPDWSDVHLRRVEPDGRG